MLFTIVPVVCLTAFAALINGLHAQIPSEKIPLGKYEENVYIYYFTFTRLVAHCVHHPPANIHSNTDTPAQNIGSDATHSGAAQQPCWYPSTTTESTVCVCVCFIGQPCLICVKRPVIVTSSTSRAFRGAHSGNRKTLKLILVIAKDNFYRFADGKAFAHDQIMSSRNGRRRRRK